MSDPDFRRDTSGDFRITINSELKPTDLFEMNFQILRMDSRSQLKEVITFGISNDEGFE
ncbi:hypothetical protein R615_10125 [Thalassolituus oleivorans R6-15]|jgi:hypothetical protein|nr:hypothetical protein R615_10125 [Thalassolituus oleivorans R6-15]